MRAPFGIALGLLVLLPSVAAPDEKGPAQAGPSRQALDGARHRLEESERKVELARGQPMKLDHDATEALEAGEGKRVQIEPGALTCRLNAVKLRDRFAEAALGRRESAKESFPGVMGLWIDFPVPCSKAMRREWDELVKVREGSDEMDQPLVKGTRQDVHASFKGKDCEDEKTGKLVEARRVRRAGLGLTEDFDWPARRGAARREAIDEGVLR